jgi:hypothetical protein
MASLIQVVVSIRFMIQVRKGLLQVRRLVISHIQPALLHLSPPLGATNKSNKQI